MPLTARDGAEALARTQREIAAASRFGIPAIAHDECLAGFTAWTAAIFPIPLAWGASFDPQLVQQMAVQIGTSMRAVGVHQGLAPVLDVTVDPRWGRTEETIGEDPYLVATVGTAYVRGLESTGLICTLKHFVGYSASRGGRNLAPAAVTARQIADLLLPPFEMAIRLVGARSVMHAYTDIDGIPTASDPYLLSDVLRDTWDFTGTVVADYFGISFLELLHGVAADPAQAAGLALAAGVDVELPTVRCFGAPLIGAVERGEVAEALVDRAARRVLRQKCELGMLDPSWDPGPATGEVDLAPAPARQIAGQLAEESIILLANDGTLPLSGPLSGGGRIAVVGPRADDPLAMLGCYSFPSHIGVKYPDLDIGVEIPTFLTALRKEMPDSDIDYAPGCGVEDPDPSGLAAAVALAASSDICIAVVGDPLFFPFFFSYPFLHLAPLPLPTPCDLQRSSLQSAPRAAPSASIPPVAISSPPPTLPTHPRPLYPFGHGLSYTTFGWEDIEAQAAQVPTDGTIGVALTVRNTGERAGTEIVQLYLHDPVAQVTRPTVVLIGYARVPLEPGQQCRVEFAVHTDLTSFIGRGGERIVEPGRIELRLGTSSASTVASLPVDLTGPERALSGPRQMTAEVRIS